MSDLTQRLRAWAHDERLGHGPLLLDAAAEIERLRDIISPGDAAAYEEGMAALLARCEAAETRLRAGTPSPDESNRHTVIEEIAAERRRQLGVLATDWRIGNAKHTDEV